MRKVRVVAILVVLGVLLSACGGSSKKGGGSLLTPTSKGSGGTVGNGNTGNDTLDKLIAKGKTAKYKITYKTDSDTITLVNLPPAAAYINGDSSFYEGANGKTIGCSGTGANVTCTDLPAGTGQTVTAMMTGLFGVYGSLLASGNVGNSFLGIKTSDRTIVGRGARCAKIDGSKFGAPGSVEICVDKEIGVLLSLITTDGTGKRSTTFEATSMSTSPTAADVTPPKTP